MSGLHRRQLFRATLPSRLPVGPRREHASCHEDHTRRGLACRRTAAPRFTTSVGTPVANRDDRGSRAYRCVSPALAALAPRDVVATLARRGPWKGGRDLPQPSRLPMLGHRINGPSRRRDSTSAALCDTHDGAFRRGLSRRSSRVTGARRPRGTSHAERESGQCPLPRMRGPGRTGLRPRDALNRRRCRSRAAPPGPPRRRRPPRSRSCRCPERTTCRSGTRTRWRRAGSAPCRPTGNRSRTAR